MALAAWMTWKCAVVGIPLRAAREGSRAIPRRCPWPELEKAHAGATPRHDRRDRTGVGRARSGREPNEQTMAWIMDTYSMHARPTVTSVVTGKPLELGGSAGRREATGRACSS